MPLFILQETPLGYALLKAKKSNLLDKRPFAPEDDTVERVCNLLKLKDFRKYENSAIALEQTDALVEGKVTPLLAKVLNSIKDEKRASLAVADPRLASAITKLPQFSLKLISDSSTHDLYRSIRNHITSLVPGLQTEEVSQMTLGLSHMLSRHKLKYSPEKIDIMIIQAIALLDDLDRELNIHAMRVKEWYGWHFPEMGRIVTDNLAYAKVIQVMGMRSNAANSDLSEILPEQIERAVKSAAEISMGTEITEEDMNNIQALAAQVISLTTNRTQLNQYLASRMQALAPNLTALVGELVGARLIAHAGSLINLAKRPASTIQILGAEKALFRALKTKHDTPKYGLIYHASLIGQASGKNKGKIARVLSAKTALGLRVDTLLDWDAEGEQRGEPFTEEEKATVGAMWRAKVERQVLHLERKQPRSRGAYIAPNGVTPQAGKWEIKEARKYNPDADGLAGDEPAATTAAKSKKNRPSVVEQMAEEARKSTQRSEQQQDTDGEGEDTEMDSDTASTPELAKNLRKGKQSSPKPLIEELEEESEPERSNDNVKVKSGNIKMKREAISPPKRYTGPSQVGIDRLKATMTNGEGTKAQPGANDESKERAARDAKLARRLHRKEKRQKKAERPEKREETEDEKLNVLALQAGLPLVRYKRKLERGEIQFDSDGKPHSISKKEIKKARKAAEKAAVKEQVSQTTKTADVQEKETKKERPAKKAVKREQDDEVDESTYAERETRKAVKREKPDKATKKGLKAEARESAQVEKKRKRDEDLEEVEKKRKRDEDLKGADKKKRKRNEDLEGADRKKRKQNEGLEGADRKKKKKSKA